MNRIKCACGCNTELNNVKLARVELALERLRIAVEELKEELEK